MLILNQRHSGHSVAIILYDLRQCHYQIDAQALSKFLSSFVLDICIYQISTCFFWSPKLCSIKRNFNFLSIMYDTECTLFVTKLGRVATEISVKNCKNHFIFCIFFCYSPLFTCKHNAWTCGPHTV